MDDWKLLLPGWGWERRLRFARAGGPTPATSGKRLPRMWKDRQARARANGQGPLVGELRVVRGTDYLFCRTRTCPIVYFSADDSQTFTVDHLRERVYQIEPDAGDVWVCYCFRHTVGDVRSASPAARGAILEDIDAGINTGQCACDLRNPQGSCCLGNVRGLIQRLRQPDAETTG